MRTLRKSLLTLVSVSAFALPSVLVTTPASAMSCPRDNLCAEGGGARGEFAKGVYDLGGFGSGRLNDHVDRVYNNTGDTWCLYPDAGYRGAAHVVGKGFQGSLGAFGHQVSSMRPRPWLGC